jgi:hypothetical protein
MALGLMMVYQRIVLEWIIDLDGRSFEERPLAFRVVSPCHSNASRFFANS